MSNISLVDLRDREVDLEDSIINRAGNDRRNNFVVSSSVTWGVSGDIEARHPYLFDSRASDPVEGIVAHTCLSGLRKTLSSPETETELLDDEDVLFHGIRSRCAAFLLDRYGVELRQFRLKGFNKHPNQIIGEALMSSLAASGVSLQLPLPAGNMNGNGHLQAETTPVQ